MSENSAATQPQRIVEFELHRPQVHLPTIDLEPARRVAEDVLLTGIGIVVLSGRALARAIKAANAAGAETAEHPGPVTKALLGLVRPANQGPVEAQSFELLPISDYDSLSAEQVSVAAAALSPAERATLRDYEAKHQKRPAVLAALDELQA